MYLCFLFGICLHNIWDKITEHSLSIAIICGIIFGMMLIPWDSRFWIIPGEGIYPVNSFDQLYSFVGPFFYRMAIGLVGSLFIITLCHLICSRYRNSGLISYFSSIGRNTLGIYLIQTILIEIIIWRWIKLDSFDRLISSALIAPLISLVIMIICIVSIKIIRKSRLMKMFLLGERNMKTE